LAAALRDRNVGARVDREWLLMKLFTLVAECEQRGTPRTTRRLVEVIQLIAKMQGWLGGRQPPSKPAPKATARSDPSERLAHLITKAQGALVAPARARPDAPDLARDPGPLGPRHGEPRPTPEPVKMPISATASEQLASAAGRARRGPRDYTPVYREPFMGVG
jgi:hypothetical protein